MITFRRILFPVDFSQQDHQAVPFVKAMAERFQSEVILLHAAEFLPITGYGAPDAMTLEPVVDLKSLMDERREHLSQHLSTDLAGLRVQRTLELGDSAREIAKYARDQKVDLIMMPTHGYGPFRRFLLGSVTAKVLHDTDCPVWTGVHTEQVWSQQQRQWRRFLCAVDADPIEAPFLRWAAQFSAEQKAELWAVHAVHASSPITGGQESAELRDFLLDAARERLAKLQSDAGTHLEILMRFGKVAEVVRSAALQQEADLVLIGRGVMQRMLGRLRSETYTIIREAPCPVISI